MQKNKFQIRDTGKHGKGVYAARGFKHGETVHTLSGEELTLEQIIDRVIAGRENEDDILQIGKRRYIDLDELSRTFNHSCDPTTGVRKTSELFALRDISKGEQLTYDYSTTIAPTDWLMRCTCGAENCRKNIQDVTTIPAFRLSHYVKNGAIQNYMKPILTQLSNRTYSIPEYERRALEKIHM